MSRLAHRLAISESLLGRYQVESHWYESSRPVDGLDGFEVAGPVLRHGGVHCS